MSFWRKLFGASKSDTPEMEIHDATWAGDLEKVKTLLKNNSNLVFSKDENGFTPLHVAAFNGHKNVAELLLANEAGVNTNENHGATPLYLAAQQGHKNLAALLLANQPRAKTRPTTASLPW